jgi:hypothetical protein
VLIVACMSHHCHAGREDVGESVVAAADLQNPGLCVLPKPASSAMHLLSNCVACMQAWSCAGPLQVVNLCLIDTCILSLVNFEPLFISQLVSPLCRDDLGESAAAATKE